MNLQRFLDAQAPVIDEMLAELHAGRKETHWMWFIFPQLKALGRSGTAKFYGLEDLAEAKRYLADPVLGPRLIECTQAVLAHPNKTAHKIFGSPDDLKFRSCLTLFMQAAPTEPVFKQALEVFCGGEPDQATLTLLGETSR